MFLFQKKDFNFYNRYLQKTAQKWGFKPIYTIAMVILVLSIGVFSYWIFAENYSLEARINELEQVYLDKLATLDPESEILNLRIKLQETNTRAENLGAAFVAIDSFPRANWELIQQVFALADGNITITIGGFRSHEGVLDMTVVSKQVSNIPDFVRRVTASGLFQSVSYTGYSANLNDYSVYMECILHGRAGREGIQ